MVGGWPSSGGPNQAIVGMVFGEWGSVVLLLLLFLFLCRCFNFLPDTPEMCLTSLFVVLELFRGNYLVGGGSEGERESESVRRGNRGIRGTWDDLSCSPSE